MIWPEVGDAYRRVFARVASVPLAVTAQRATGLHVEGRSAVLVDA